MTRELQTVASGRFLRLVKDGTWEFVQRINATGVVIVTAITEERHVLFVRQFRAAVNQEVIEFPAGLVGDDDASESLDSAARRELLEETGYLAGRLTKVFVGPSSAGLTDETVTVFVADQLVRESAGGGVGAEDITNFSVALDDVESWLAEQQVQGYLVGARVFTGLHLLRRYLEN